jgi:hypothetical protein
VTNFTPKQRALYNRASETLAFDDIYEFLLQLWPREVDCSNRDNLNYSRMTGRIKSLEKFDEHQEQLEALQHGNLFVHLDYAILVAVHHAGLVMNRVRMRELNREYVRHKFQAESIGYVMEKDKDKIPKGIRDNLDKIYDIELVKEYFKRLDKS